MKALRILTNFNIEVELPLASFPRRLAAWCVDVVLMVLYLFLAGYLFQSLSPALRISEGFSMVMALIIFGPLFIYHLLCEWFFAGQSLGKMLMKIRVVTEVGAKPTLSQYAVRWMIRTSDYTILILIVVAQTAAGNPQAVWYMGTPFLLLVADLVLLNTTPRSQRLGDLLARTLVVRVLPQEDLSKTVFMHTETDYKVQFPEVMRLRDRDMNSVKHILDISRKHGDYAMAERASYKIQEHLGIRTSLSAFDFLEALLKDYNHLSVNK